MRRQAGARWPTVAWRAVVSCAAALVAVLSSRATVAPASARSATGEAIREFTVSMDVDAGGVLHVVEVVDWDFGTADRHGIFRNIPVRVRHDDTHDRLYDVRVVSVKSDTAPDGFTVDSTSPELMLRIGDPNRTVTGLHRYTITYDVHDALAGFDDHDELYWNAIGTGWAVPIDRAGATVRVPGAPLDATCFAGERGATNRCEPIRTGDATAFTASGLAATEGLTVVVSLPKGVVLEPTPVLVERWTIGQAFAVTPATGAVTIVVAVGVVGGLVALARRGRDRRPAAAGGTAVGAAFGAQMEDGPPDGLRPAQAGTLVDEKAQPVDASATLVDLAVRGYLRIDELRAQPDDEPDWRVVRLRDTSALLPYEALLCDRLFAKGDGTTVVMSELSQQFASDLSDVRRAIYDDVVAHGWFDGRPDSARVRGWLLAILGAVGAWAVAVVLLVISPFGFAAAVLAAGGVALLFVAPRLPRRTAAGTDLLRRVEAFRQQLADRGRTSSLVAERPDAFSQYLPYAIVFGLTGAWSNVLADAGRTPPRTEWYSSPYPRHSHGFLSSVGAFSTSSASTMSSAPPSSSSSGSSGFSGSSGGGGGGGGGGSW